MTILRLFDYSNVLFPFFKVSENNIHKYAPIVHEDGLETAILGLDMQITRSIFYSRQKYLSVKETSRHNIASSPSDVASSVGDEYIKLLLQCKSEIATRDHGRNKQKTHARKSAVHQSLGYLFLSGKIKPKITH